MADDSATPSHDSGLPLYVEDWKVATRIRNVLSWEVPRIYGVGRLSRLTTAEFLALELSESKVKNFHGIGKERVAQIQNYLQHFGQSLKK